MLPICWAGKVSCENLEPPRFGRDTRSAPLPSNAALAGLDEGEEVLNLVGCGNICSRFINAFCGGKVFSEENAVGLF